jgi:predicted amidohydrolase YtcJ
MVRIFTARRILARPGTTVAAFAVEGERIAAVGTRDELAARFAAAEVVDLGDAVIVPGFVDAHAHLAMAAEDVLHLDLSPHEIASLPALLAAVRAQAARVPPGGWIRGSRYDDGKTAGGRVLTRAELDAAAPDHPALVVHVAAHWGVVNSRALALAGIDENTPDPPGGRFGRDAAGRLNGIVFEQALFDFANPALARGGRSIAPESSLEDRLNGLAIAQEMFHSAGITSLGDAMVGPSDWSLFNAALDRGALTIRVNALITHQHYELSRSATSSDPLRLRVGGVKAFVDGAIAGRTCALEQPFEGTTDDFGMQTTPTAELHDLVRMVHEDGGRVCAHANGDRAIRLLLDGFEAAQARKPVPTRHRIEHCSIVNEAILDRMRKLGAIAVPFAGYVGYHGGKLLEWYGPARVERMFAHRWFLDAGVGVAASSDYPCGPYEPLFGMQSCVTRTGGDGSAVGGSQRISPSEALALFTSAAADAAGEGAFKGVLAPGYLADFVALDDDPTTITPEAIAAIGVRETYVGGERVYASLRKDL